MTLNSYYMFCADIPEIDKVFLDVDDNGIINIYWDAISNMDPTYTLNEEQISYDLIIMYGPNETCYRMENISYQRSFYNFNPHNLTCPVDNPCLVFVVYVIPVINNEFSGQRKRISTGI